MLPALRRTTPVRRLPVRSFRDRIRRSDTTGSPRGSAAAAWAKSTARKTRAWAAMSPSRCCRVAAQDDPERRSRFMTEARAASALRSPHIATIYDIGEEDGVVFLAMEYVDGETLSARVARGPLVPVEGLDIASQVADALTEAHERGIVHRDIKSANVMITVPRRREGARLRACQVRQRGRTPGPRGHRHVREDDGGDGPGHGVLHVAGAGARPPGGRTVRSVLPGGRALRDADRPPPLRGPELLRDRRCHHQPAAARGCPLQLRADARTSKRCCGRRSRRTPRTATSPRETSTSTCAAPASRSRRKHATVRAARADRARARRRMHSPARSPSSPSRTSRGSRPTSGSARASPRPSAQT